MLRLDVGPPAMLEAGASFTLSVAVTLGELGAADMHVECQLGLVNAPGKFEVRDTLLPAAARAGETLYSAVVTPALSGLAAMRIRAWPTHPLLAHRFEVGRMRWR
jgi:starch phosphorylase